MTREQLEPALITFMYFMHEDSVVDPMAPNEFFDKWSNTFYDFDDMSNGVFNE